MKSPQKSFLFKRLDKLRVVTGKTWQEIAADLNVDRSLLFHVKAGTRNLGPKVLHRLQQAEVAAGISKDAKSLIRQGLKGKEHVNTLLEEDDLGTANVTVADIDKGVKEIVLAYRRGSPPSRCPSKIEICAPGNAMVWKVVGRTGLLDDPTPLLLACLPKKFSKPAFLDLLTPACYRQLVEVAMTLVFGLNWMANTTKDDTQR